MFVTVVDCHEGPVQWWMSRIGFPISFQHAPSHTLLPSLLLRPRFPPTDASSAPSPTCPPQRHASPLSSPAMGRKPKISTPSSDDSALDNVITWKYTKTMNMEDLARDDDYLSHLFIEKLGSLGPENQMLVHRMDPRRRLPKTDGADILAIIRSVSVVMLLLVFSLTHGNADAS